MPLDRKGSYPHVFHVLTAVALAACVTAVLPFLNSFEGPHLVEGVQVETDNVTASAPEEQAPQEDAEEGLSVGTAAYVVFLLVAVSYTIVAIPLCILGYRLLPRERRRFVPWQVEDALLLVGGLFLMQVTAAAMLASMGEGGSLLAGMLLTQLAGFVAAAAILWIGRWKYGLEPFDLGLRLQRWKSDLGGAASLMLIVLSVQFPIAVGLSRLYEQHGQRARPQELVHEMTRTDSSWEFLIFAMGAVLLAAVWEEIFFRGFLQPFLRRYVGAFLAILLTAAVFALVHYSRRQLYLDSVVQLFPLALALGILRHRTERLTGPILLHALHNGFTVFLLFLSRV